MTKLFSLASIRRLIAPVVCEGHTAALADGSMREGFYAPGLYCIVEWGSADKSAIRVRNMNCDRDAEPLAAALRAAGLSVAIETNERSSLNRITLNVRA